MLHLLIPFFLLAAAPAKPPATLPLAQLQASARKLSELKLERRGELDIDAVRQRVGALAALVGASRPLLRGEDVPSRLAAHLAIAEAHEAFGKELFATKAPRAARSESVARAWADQVEITMDRALTTARAHLRSCVELSKNARVADPGCAAGLTRLGMSTASSADPRETLTARASELQGCYDSAAGEGHDKRTLTLDVRVVVGGQGRVTQVELAPRGADGPRAAEQRALYDCVSDGIWIWVFPGEGNVEIEFPLALAAPR